MKRRINIDEAMMSSLGLVSEYENVDVIKIDKVASSVKETTIEKYAGIFINNPTQENIEDFIRKYMYNELTFFPRILEITVEFIPSTFDKSHPDYVSDGTGIIGIKVRHKVVELPFLVRDGELDPFDVIQMDGQRAPYSRDNLQKIILNLDKQIEQEQNGVSGDGVGSPYQGLEDYNNAATTPGFMGDVLAIRDSQSMRNGAGMYVTAGDYEYGFEKEAGVFGGLVGSSGIISKAKNKIKETHKNVLDQAAKNFATAKFGDDKIDFEPISDDTFKNTVINNGKVVTDLGDMKFVGHEKQLYVLHNDGKFGKVQSIFMPSQNLILKQAAEDYNVFPFGEENTDNLEHQFEKALERINKEKPTTKAPKGIEEKAYEEEKLAGTNNLSQEDMVRKAIQHFEGPMQHDNKGNFIRMDDRYLEAYNTMRKQDPKKIEVMENEIKSTINPYTKAGMPSPMKQKLKFGDISDEWFGDYKDLDKHKNSEIVLGWPDERVHTKANYGVRHVLHNPDENKYYYAQFDNDVPSDYDMSRIQDEKRIEEIDPKWINDFKSKGVFGNAGNRPIKEEKLATFAPKQPETPSWASGRSNPKSEKDIINGVLNSANNVKDRINKLKKDKKQTGLSLKEEQLVDKYNNKYGKDWVGDNNLSNQFNLEAGNGLGKKADIVTDLNDLLEKTSNIKPMSDEELESIAYVLSKKAHDKFVNKLEKISSETTEPTRRELEVIEKKASFKFTDASSVEHGEFIVFPEINGNEVSLTPAIVLSNLDTTMIKVKGKTYKFICAIDGRIKVLENGEKFLCSKAPDKAFKLPTTGLSTLQEKDTFFAIKGNNVIPPSAINYIATARIGKSDDFSNNSIDKVATLYKCVTIDCSDIKRDVYFNSSMGDKHNWRRGQYVITSVDGNKFENMKYNDFLEAKSKELGLSQEKINAVMPKWDLGLEEGNNNILTSDISTPVIKIKGVITTNFKSQDEYETKSRLYEAGYDVEKVAFTVNMVTVYCVDRNQNLFNMTVDYKDTEERFMNLRKQIFNRISKGKLKAILRILKFEGNIITEIIFKAKNEQKAQYPIPASCTIENIQEIQGGDMHNVSKESVKGAVQKYINPLNIAKGIAIATASGLVKDGLGEIVKNNPAIGQAAQGMAKYFSESVELSGAFEKAAQEYENEDFLDYARVLALSGHFSEKVATVIKDNNNVYPSIKDVAHEIVMAKPVLEKFAYDLTALKVSQGIQRKEVLPVNLIRGAIENMDTLYKIAYGIDTTISKDDLTFK